MTFRSMISAHDILQDMFLAASNVKRKLVPCEVSVTAKEELKRSKVLVSDIEKSRRRGKAKSEAPQRELDGLPAELEQLRSQISEKLSSDSAAENKAASVGKKQAPISRATQLFFSRARSVFYT